MENKFISRQDLNKWLFELVASGRRLYAPVQKGKITDFDYVGSVSDISFSHIQTAQSAKGSIFPRAERLFGYSRNKSDVSLTDFDAASLPFTVVFGARPCDMAGNIALHGILNWDTVDKIFSERMSRTVFITVSCAECDEYCFCTSVGGSAGNTAGSDIVLTCIGDDGYLVEVVSEKGTELVEGFASLFSAARDVKKEDYLAKVPVKFSREAISKRLQSAFDLPVWERQSARCIGCGACAFVCPACACFDIQENVETTVRGERLRCWDSCCFSLFTLHTSGHNPRPTQSTRWRQRLLHKFAYMPSRQQVSGCTGCGRCSRACPVDMNIAEHLSEIAAVE